MTRRTSFAAALVCASLFLQTSTRAQTTTNHIFYDDFHRTTGLGSNWNIQYGSFTTDGTYAVSGTPPINGNWANVVPALGTSDYSISANIIIPTYSVNSGLVVRSTDSTSFNRNVYATKIGTDGTVNLYRRKDWNWTLLSSVPAGIVANTSYALQLVAKGTDPVHLEVWLNGTRQINVDDGSADRLTSGAVGLVNYDSGVKYTNFAIDNAPTHVFTDDFHRTSGMGSNWHLWYTGAWTTDGTYAVSGTAPTNGNWASVVPNLGTNDYSVSANIIIPAGSLSSGLVVRSSDSGSFSDNLYAAQLSKAGTVNLYRRNSWNWALLSSVNAGIVVNTTYAVKLVATGTNPVHLEVWLNGTPQIIYDDNSTSQVFTGAVGMENYDANVKYTNFTVDSFSPSQPRVSVSVSGSGHVTSTPPGIDCPATSCSMSVASGTNVTLSAQADPTYNFSGWTGDCTGNGACNLLAVTADKAVSAGFTSTQVFPCRTHRCAHGEFPPGDWRPYDGSSPFNTPVSQSASLIPESICSNVPVGSTCSDQIRIRMLGDIPQSDSKHPANWVASTDGYAGWPTYYGTDGDPTFSIACSKYGGCPAMPQGQAPSGAIVQGNGNPHSGSDMHLTFIDQFTSKEFDLWQVSVSRLPNGGTIQTGFSGWTSANGDGRSQYGEGNAGHMGSLAGRIRAEEMTYALAQSDQNLRYINHALTIAVNCTNGNVSVSPAGSNKGRACGPGTPPDNPGLNLPLGDTNAPPMGAHIHLNMTFAQINVLGIPEWKKVLLRTLSLYGAFINDTGSIFYFTWQTESGAQYITFNVTDQWLALGQSLYTQGGNDWYHCDDITPPDEWCLHGYKGVWNDSHDTINWDTDVWSHLRVLAPP